MPPRCSAVPPAPPPGRANSNHSAPAASRGDAGDCNPLGNNDTAAAAVAGKVDNTGQENNDHSGNNGDDNKDNEKWGRGTSFNSSSSSLSSVVGHLISDTIAAAGSLLLGIAVPRIDVQHRDSPRPRRRRTSSGLTKRWPRRKMSSFGSWQSWTRRTLMTMNACPPA